MHNASKNNRTKFDDIINPNLMKLNKRFLIKAKELLENIWDKVIDIIKNVFDSESV